MKLVSKSMILRLLHVSPLFRFSGLSKFITRLRTRNTKQRFYSTEKNQREFLAAEETRKKKKKFPFAKRKHHNYPLVPEAPRSGIVSKRSETISKKHLSISSNRSGVRQWVSIVRPTIRFGLGSVFARRVRAYSCVRRVENYAFNFAKWPSVRRLHSESKEKETECRSITSLSAEQVVPRNFSPFLPPLPD